MRKHPSPSFLAPLSLSETVLKQFWKLALYDVTKGVATPLMPLGAFGFHIPSTVHSLTQHHAKHAGGLKTYQFQLFGMLKVFEGGCKQRAKYEFFFVFWTLVEFISKCFAFLQSFSTGVRDE